jgi:flagella basal body P-ring formation protein FlgA
MLRRKKFFGSFFQKRTGFAFMLLLASMPPLMPALMPASAATLRASGTLTGDTVRVSDLWDGAGAAGSLVLGPAPAPGASITVAAPQLAAIARAYGVDWRPGTGAERAVLVRPGQPLARAAVLAVLYPALAAQGAGGHPDASSLEVSLPDFQPPMLDAGPPPALSVESLVWDPGSGRFAAMLDVAPSAGPALSLRLAGYAYALAPALVAARVLPAGAILGAADVQAARRHAAALPRGAATDAAQLIGMQLRRDIASGQVLTTDDIRRPIVVTNHARVLMALSLPGLRVGATGEALQDGAVGDRIGVRNPASGAVLTADVTGPGTVEVDPASTQAPAAPVP